MLKTVLIVCITCAVVSGFQVPIHKSNFASARGLASTKLYAESNLAKNAMLGALASILFINQPSIADDTSSFPKVPLYTKRSSDVQPFADVGRGFKLLRLLDSGPSCL